MNCCSERSRRVTRLVGVSGCRGVHRDAAHQRELVGFVNLLPLPRNPFLESNEAEHEFGLLVVKQLDENEMRVREPVVVGRLLRVPQEPFVGLEEFLAEAQRRNPVLQVERAHQAIAVDIPVQQSIGYLLRMKVEVEQRFEVNRPDLFGLENPGNGIARGPLRLDRILDPQRMQQAVPGRRLALGIGGLGSDERGSVCRVQMRHAWGPVRVSTTHAQAVPVAPCPGRGVCGRPAPRGPSRRGSRSLAGASDGRTREVGGCRPTYPAAGPIVCRTTAAGRYPGAPPARFADSVPRAGGMAGTAGETGRVLATAAVPSDSASGRRRGSACCDPCGGRAR